MTKRRLARGDTTGSLSCTPTHDVMKMPPRDTR
jgi:hypothetical protein